MQLTLKKTNRRSTPFASQRHSNCIKVCTKAKQKSSATTIVIKRLPPATSTDAPSVDEPCAQTKVPTVSHKSRILRLRPAKGVVSCPSLLLHLTQNQKKSPSLRCVAGLFSGSFRFLLENNYLYCWGGKINHDVFVQRKMPHYRRERCWCWGVYFGCGYRLSGRWGGLKEEVDFSIQPSDIALAVFGEATPSV